MMLDKKSGNRVVMVNGHGTPHCHDVSAVQELMVKTGWGNVQSIFRAACAHSINFIDGLDTTDHTVADLDRPCVGGRYLRLK